MSIEILMPALSPTMEVGTLSKWLVKVGDEVSSGDLIAEIETDKATMEVESIDNGIIGKLLVSEGSSEIRVNSPIAIILESGEDIKDIEIKKTNDIQLKKNNADTLHLEKTNDVNNKDSLIDKSKMNLDESDFSNKLNTETIKSKNRVFSSPLARRLAKEKGIDLSKIKGSGPNERIVKKDIDNVSTSLENENIEILNNNNFKLVKNSNIRKVIAERLLKSTLEAPHFYLTLDCEIDNLLKFRSDINKVRAAESKISVNDFIIKAAGLSLLKVPETNVSWDKENTKYYNTADISVAVAIEGGLITPIIKNVERKGLESISKEVKKLIIKAKEGSLLPEEYNGGSFSISNLGMFGIKHFTSIINPPQGAILAVGSGEKKPVVKNDKIEIATLMNVTLSCDHRVIDGATGSKFLNIFKQFIETPSLMIL